jgi:REP element-mobilizing transposase RayT
MLYYRRRLPHWIPDHATMFVTWRLAGSIPPRSPDVLTVDNTGRTSFRVQDERMDRSICGPFWLRQPWIASMVEDALRYGETTRRFYHLYAWVIMPNHVHVVFEPHSTLSTIMRWLKGRTSREANRHLGRTGMPFWQDESYDHWIRTNEELHNVIGYVENNPVKAGLIDAKELWPWSSARLQADDTNRSSAPHRFNEAHQPDTRAPTAATGNRTSRLRSRSAPTSDSTAPGSTRQWS